LTHKTYDQHKGNIGVIFTAGLVEPSQIARRGL